MKRRKLIIKKRGKNALSLVETAFALEYVRNKGQAAKAYRKVMKNENSNDGSVQAMASMMLKREEVWNEVNRLFAKMFKAPRITAGRVLQETARIAFFDPRELFKLDGSLKSIKDLDDDTAAAITSFKVTDHPSLGTITYDVTLAPKLEALKVLGKYKNIFRDTPGFGINVEKGGVLVVPMPLEELEWEKQAKDYYQRRQLVYDGEVVDVKEDEENKEDEE